MTEIGESVNVATDPGKAPEEELHWLEVNYCYPDGLPVEGRYIATDAEGFDHTGILNDQGGLCLNHLPAGQVEVELLRPAEDAELKQLRQQIKAVLDEMIAEKRAETAETEARLAQMSTLEKTGEIAGAVGEGLWNGAVGLIEFVWGTVKTAAEVANYLSPLNKVNNLLESVYESYRAGSLTEEQWLQSIQERMTKKELDDLAQVLGFDPRNFDPALVAEAYEITAFIAEDEETLKLLKDFAKDYAGAQSTLDWAEFAGGGVFEIVLAALLVAFTGGVGVAGQVGSKIRHVGRLRKLGLLFRRLGKLLKRRKLHRKLKVDVDKKKKLEAEMPAGAKLSPNRLAQKKIKCFKKNKRGDPAEYDRQLKDQQDGLNNLTADEYLAGRQAYNGKRASTAATRDEFADALTKQYRAEGMSKSEAIAAATKKMKTLDALHSPDLIAGGADKISGFGDKGVNRSIGAQWKSGGRLDELDQAARDAVARGDGGKKMNVRMQRCK